MKASIKFREDQKPLVRAKIPLNIASLPFQSSIIAGDSKELSLNLSTFFSSGPSLKLAYKPNDSLNPFTLVFRTGIGHYGSPVNSPMSMSAEFNLIGTQNPRFFIHFKPKLGDFSFKKSQSSDFVVKGVTPKSKLNGGKLDDDVLVETAEKGLFYGKRIGVLPESGAAGGVLSGAEASARTVLPVLNKAVVNFRWGVRFPKGEMTASAAGGGISVRELPVLVMSKIGIEHVANNGAKESDKVISGLNFQGSGGGVGETYLLVKRQLELIQVENEMLKKAMDDLKSEFAAGKWTVPAGGCGSSADLGKYKKGDRGAKPSGGRVDRWNSGGDKRSSEYNGKASEADVNVELKKAVKDATGA
ncbi:hypothetical protein RHGRI_006259 [Rhododendron griersonianum]|uniref:Uncharacterized protein n=1 Tax=Rhododendron griersonianum TaxID=479676 RepID=A0AAV6KTH5_9ERIC|nr:hypothetical protein RHGRI_006259 [Rhododendron griersonianum]